MLLWHVTLSLYQNMRCYFFQSLLETRGCNFHDKFDKIQQIIVIIKWNA